MLETTRGQIRDRLAAGASGYGDATPAEIRLLHTLLRRILRLSDDATVEEINCVLIALDQSGGTLQALSASRLPALSAALPATEQTIRRQLGICEETWLRFNRN
jgi:hypothetical protein